MFPNHNRARELEKAEKLGLKSRIFLLHSTGEVMKVKMMKALLIAIASLTVAFATAAQAQYRIQSGDTLQIEVLEDPSLNRSVLVLPDGTVSFPFAGSVTAAGRTAGDVQSAVTSGIASNFANEPTVFVTVQSTQPRAASGGGSSTRQIDVFMMGEIGSPGAKALERGTTLIQALATTGGFTKFAATKRILLRRTDPRTGQQTVSRINYKAIADGAAVGQDVVLQDGDVFPQRQPSR